MIRSGGSFSEACYSAWGCTYGSLLSMRVNSQCSQSQSQRQQYLGFLRDRYGPTDSHAVRTICSIMLYISITADILHYTCSRYHKLAVRDSIVCTRNQCMQLNIILITLHARVSSMVFQAWCFKHVLCFKHCPLAQLNASDNIGTAKVGK